MYVRISFFSSSRSHALSIPDQIRALEKLAQIDAELKGLQEQLSQERSTLDGLRSGIAKLDEKLARGPRLPRGHGQDAGRAHPGRAQHEPAARALAREAVAFAHRARDERRAARARGAAQAGARPRRRDRQADDRVGQRRASRSKRPRPSTRSSSQDLGAREGDISSKLGEVEREAAREAGRARRGDQGAAASALPSLRHDPPEAGQRASRRRPTAPARLATWRCRRSSFTASGASRSSSSVLPATASSTSSSPQPISASAPPDRG